MRTLACTCCMYYDLSTSVYYDHTCTTIIAHPSTMFLVHACTMVIVHVSCRICYDDSACMYYHVLVHACTMIIIHASCPTRLKFIDIKEGGPGGVPQESRAGVGGRKPP